MATDHRDANVMPSSPGNLGRGRRAKAIFLRDRLRMVVVTSMGVIQAWDVDPTEPWPDGRHCPQDQAVSN